MSRERGTPESEGITTPPHKSDGQAPVFINNSASHTSQPLGAQQTQAGNVGRGRGSGPRAHHHSMPFQHVQDRHARHVGGRMDTGYEDHHHQLLPYTRGPRNIDMFRRTAPAVITPPSHVGAYELKLPNVFTGDMEVIGDWMNIDFMSYGNFAAFISTVSPAVTLSSSETNSPMAPRRATMDDDETINEFASSANGSARCDSGMTPADAVGTRAFSETTSARSTPPDLGLVSAPPRAVPATAAPMAPPPAERGEPASPPGSSAAAPRGRPSSSVPLPPGANPGFPLAELWKAFWTPFGVTVRFEQPVSLSPLKQYDHEIYYTPQLSGFHLTVRDDCPTLPPDTPRDFSWFARDKPDARPPFYNQMNDILQRDEYRFINDAVHTDFTIGSWFAVLWVPIHIKNHVQNHSAGSFLCFYLINPPLAMTGSRFTGQEVVFRTDRLAVKKAVWEHGAAVQAHEPIDATSPARKKGSTGAAVETSTPPTGTPSSVPTPVLPAAATSGRVHPASSDFPTMPITSPALDLHGNARNSPTPSGGAAEPGGFMGQSGPAADAQSVDSRHDSAPMATLRLPIFGVIPSRFRTDVWLKPVSETARRFSHAGPLFLIAAAFQLLNHEQNCNPKWTDDHRLVDAFFMTRHERTMLEFMALYAS